MFGRTLVCVVLFALAASVLGEDPVTVTVGHRDGGVVGFRSGQSIPYFFHTTPTGAFAINHGQRETIAEWTVPSNPKNVDALAEPHDAFGTTPATATRPRDPLSSARMSIPPASSAQTLSDIPMFESALRLPELSIKKALRIRDHAGFYDSSKHPGAGGTLMLNDAQQWALFSHDDFQDSSDGWALSVNGTQRESVADKRQGCNGNPDLHLGGYCAFSSHEVTRLYKDLPPHNTVQITARMHFFDLWRGEYAFAKVDGNMLWQQSHSFCPKPFSEFCKGIDSCGDNKYSDKLSQVIRLVINHKEPTLKLSFGSSLEVAPCVASWAIDDVALYTKV